MDNSLFFLLFNNKILMTKVWRLVPEINIKLSSGMVPESNEFEGKGLDSKWRGGDRPLFSIFARTSHHPNSPFPLFAPIQDPPTTNDVNKVVRQVFKLGKSYSIKNMNLWNDIHLCRYRMIPLLKYLIKLPGHIKEGLVMKNGLNCFQLSFPSLQPFLKYNTNYDTYLFFYNNYQHIFQLGKEYLNKDGNENQLDKEDLNSGMEKLGLSNDQDEMRHDVMVDACLAGNLQIVQHLVTVAGYKLHNNPQLLENACKSGSTELVKWLALGQNDKVKGTNEMMAIAIKLGSLDMLKCLHQHQSKYINSLFDTIKKQSSSEPSLLDYAVRNGSLEITKYVIENGLSFKIDKLSVNMFLENGNKDLFDYLVKRKDLNLYHVVNDQPIMSDGMSHCWYNSCLDHAVKSKNPEFIKHAHDTLAAEYGKTIRPFGTSALLMAVNTHRVDIVKFMEQFPSVSILPNMLFIAACSIPVAKSRKEMAYYLLDRFNCQTCIFPESLICATGIGDFDLVQLIFEHLSDYKLDIEANQYVQLIEKASESLNIEVLEYLYNHLYRLNNKSLVVDHIYILKLVERTKEEEPKLLIPIFKFLIQFIPLTMNLADKHMYRMILSQAVTLKKLGIVKILLEKGVDVDDDMIQTAIKDGNLEILQCMVPYHESKKSDQEQQFMIQYFNSQDDDQLFQNIMDSSFRLGKMDIIAWIHTLYPRQPIQHFSIRAAFSDCRGDLLQYMVNKGNARQITLLESDVVSCLDLYMSRYKSENDIGDRYTRDCSSIKAIKVQLEDTQTDISFRAMASILNYACRLSSVPFLKYLLAYIESSDTNNPFTELERKELLRNTNFVANSTNIAFIKWCCNNQLVDIPTIKSFLTNVDKRNLMVWNPEILQYYNQYVTEKELNNNAASYAQISQMKHNRVLKKHFTIY